MLWPIKEDDSDAVKAAKRTQQFIMEEVAQPFLATLKELRLQSQKIAHRYGALDFTVDNTLEPGMTMPSKCGVTGGGTQLSDGRYIFVHVGQNHYGISDDKVEIRLCKSQKISPGEGLESNLISSLTISAPPGKLKFDEISNALRLIADTIDVDQWRRDD